MATPPRSSWDAKRRLAGSAHGTRDSISRRRDASRGHPAVVSFDEAYSFALRVAFLHYLLQPRKKRKEYISKQKAVARANTSSSIGDLMKELVPGGSSSSSSHHKLPSGFRRALEQRLSGVLRGVERLPGYADSSLKRTFAEAYTAFTAKDFQKSIDKDRKVEPLVLIFYSSATRALGRGKAPDDSSWKLMVDRHLAMFIRLLASILRDQGAERDRPDLLARLGTFEKKLLTNDQDLSLDALEQESTSIEVEIPPSCEVKDMPMVQAVGCIFGKANSAVQADINANKSTWTEEAALKDLKAYQFRLSANMAGTLQQSDFDVDESFVQWRKQETTHLVHLFAGILTVRPELRGASSSHDKAMPIRPQSLYGEEQAFAEISKMLANSDTRMDGLDQSINLGSLSLEDTNSIRGVDEPNYTFIPADPRPVYKTILQYAMSFDLLHSDPTAPYSVLSDSSVALLEELSVRWRIPQFSRCIILVEAAARKFLDQEIAADQLMTCIRYAKAPDPLPKKPPLIPLYGTALPDIEPKRWTMTDFAGYQQALKDVHDALLRELHTLLLQCYEPKPPSIAVIMNILMNHIYDDVAFAPRQAEEAEFSQQLEAGLRESAKRAYEGYLATSIPSDADEWTFAHIVRLGQQVTGLCDKIKKRYRKNPEMFGVNPFKVLVEVMFPIFENDTHDFISRVLQLEKERAEEIALEDGFALYEELVAIRNIHASSLPNMSFVFHVEDLLEVFVWRWIKTAEEKITVFVENSIKQDQFQVRTVSPEDIPTDSQRRSTSIIDTFAMINQTIDFVVKLKWQDEVHCARFMTALARIVSVGVGRYCELVDQSFAKEMDRQTSQEVAAAAARTTQERLLQYAKDTWNTKDKIEPFQFYAESFVKFNNVEYAMQELDKLFQVMNVEACAELLARVDGAKQVNKRSTKFVFTIKIVEAEDLKACDPTGLSDPYVVLCDEYQKRLAKTRVITKNLSPRWDESVDITVSGPLNVIATIWDYDVFGDHDFVGRTSLKLDPIHFSDYLPREFWLDLDTQGRLLLRVSMEGERDDIQFYFGKAFRHLKRTERDMVRGITDKLTTHINASLSRTTLGGVLNRGIAASMANLWKKRQSSMPAAAPIDPAVALQVLFTYFDDNFEIMKKTLTEATMMAVMTRLWKEVLLAMENLLVPPLSDKPSPQKPLTQAELDVVYTWLELLYGFFHARDEATGEVLGIPEDVLKSPKWLELRELNFFYFDATENLIRISERMAAANMERARQQQQQEQRNPNRLSAPATLGGGTGGGATFSGIGAFGSLGTIRRGKSIMMSRNLGTMRRAKEEKRKEAQADPSDDMILRILRMRPEATGYLKERYRQKERVQAQQAAAMIVRQSIHQGWNSGPAFGGALYGRNNLPRR